MRLVIDASDVIRYVAGDREETVEGLIARRFNSPFVHFPRLR